MKIVKYLLLCFIFWAFVMTSARPIYADSFYSSTGFGVTQYYTSAHAVAMGGIGLAIIDDLGINEINPAANESYNLTRITGDFLWEETTQKQQSSKSLSRFANPLAFRVLIPVKKSTLLSFAFNPIARTKVDFTSSAKFVDAEYTREIIQEGGLIKGNISIKIKPLRFLDFGVGANFNFGKYTDTWKIDFLDNSYIDGKDVFSTNLQGTNFTVGTVLTPVKNLHIGLIYENKVRLNGNTTIRFSSQNEQEIPDRHPILASSFGLGFSFLIKQKVLVGMDYIQRNWSEHRIIHISSTSLNDAKRLGFGLQYRARQEFPASFFQRAAFRIGGYYGLLAFQEPDGDNISETFVSFGLGIPFQGNRGRIDFAVELGKRGNLPENVVEENIIRFSVSLLGAERWFIRRY